MANTPTMGMHEFPIGRDSVSRIRSPALTAVVLLFSALFGLAAGMAWSLSPLARTVSEADYPLRVSLPEMRILSPSLDVLTTSDRELSDDPAGVVTAPEDEDPASRDASPSDATRALRETARPVATGPGGMLALDYDLARYAAANSYNPSDGSIQTRMPLIVDGVARGTADIRVADNAQILIATSSVARAIGSRASTLGPRLSAALENGTGFLPFYELRAAGIEVQYDAVQDRIALTLPS
ncbi:hypothetical protein [Altererythrobacter sp. GH1-8]|uniref:hypothetical protein n=1 Tax=Altererythrobacter sp. GH1-8 TaxID=3349333 RepID=UPI00374D74ED